MTMIKKVDTTAPIIHQPPYQINYAERIPVIHIFRNAVASLYSNRGKGKPLYNSLHNFAELLFQRRSYLAAECGVYKGNCLIACAEIAREYGLPIHIYGLDTFSGLPELSETDKLYAIKTVLKKNSEMFSDTSVSEVQAKIEEKDLSKYISLVPGLFQNTLSSLPEKKYFFVNIDCDLYEPHLECLEFFYPRMESGGIIFFDDYHSVEFPMARVAIDKFMDGRQETLFHLRYGEEAANHTKAFIVKY